MYRFAAIIWDADDPNRSKAARELKADFKLLGADWETVLDFDGLSVIQAAPGRPCWRAYPLPEGPGVVLGTLFRRGSAGEASALLETFDGQEALRVIKTKGRSLVEDFWGRYVAIVRDKRHYHHFVLRDPCGQLSCYHARISGVHIYFSDPSLLASCSRFRASFDSRLLVANIMVPELAIRRTGLSGVTELLPGECQEVENDRIDKKVYWSPASVIRIRMIDDLVQAGTILRETVESCVSGWSSCYQTLIHNLSGGLDSSIVLACLTRAAGSAEVLCLNYRTADAEGDERFFARLAAQKADCELLTFEIPTTRSLAPLLSAHPRTASPSGTIFGQLSKTRERAIALEHGAEAFTSGEGGDHLFYQMKTPFVAADFARRYGLGTRTLKAVLDAALWTQRPFWSVMGHALRHGLLRRRWMAEADHDPDEFPYLDPDLRYSVDSTFVEHPWVREAALLPPGKAYQVHVLAKVFRQPEVSPRSHLADIVHPLLSQPIVEHALQTPSYLLTHGGESRALARKAFRDLVPAEILSRRSKGGTTGHFVRLVLDNLKEVQEFLCDGLLVAQHIVDRAGLEDYLSPARIQRPGEIATALKLLSTEAWLRTWARAEISD